MFIISRKLGEKRVILNTTDAQPGACALYEKVGFKLYAKRWFCGFQDDLILPKFTKFANFLHDLNHIVYEYKIELVKVD